jgi:hypothetical protein
MRNIAIVGDGYSDYLVIKKFIKCLLRKHKDETLEDDSFIDLKILSIHDSLTKYIDKVKLNGDYSYHTREAKDLINKLVIVYYTCYGRFKKELEQVSSREIIIINADSERLIHGRLNYFDDWAYSLKGLLNYSIEIFYDRMVENGNSYEFLPLITPLILFPSSEILVASCIYNSSTNDMRKLNPNPSLKTKVYGSSSIEEVIKNGEFDKILDTFLTSENLNEIYREIPEARMLIHSLIA